MTKNSNIDINEKIKFDNIANQWWDLEGPMKALHIINPTRLKFIFSKNTSLKGLKILDVGCGGGILSESVASLGAHVIGIDISPQVIEIANSHSRNKKLNLEYFCLSIEDLPETQKNSFDIILCMELLEHVPDPKLLIKHCLNYLKPNGQLYLSTINRTLKAFVFGILASEYILQILPKNTHTYEKFIKPSELDKILRALNYQITRISGISYNPFSNSSRLVDDNSINYILEAKNIL